VFSTENVKKKVNTLYENQTITNFNKEVKKQKKGTNQTSKNATGQYIKKHINETRNSIKTRVSEVEDKPK